jgi:hypothetical protein
MFEIFNYLMNTSLKTYYFDKVTGIRINVAIILKALLFYMFSMDYVKKRKFTLR